MSRLRGMAALNLWLAAVVAGVAVAGSCFAEDKPAATNENQFAISLTDGTRLVCVPLIASVPVKTSYAALEIPFEKIAKAVFDKDKKSATLQLVNGDQIQGESTLETIKVRALIGEFAVAMTNVQEIANVRETKPKFMDTPKRRNACINNLRIIDAGKEQWAMASRRSDGDVTDVRGISEYIKGNTLPVCPSGGTYKVNVIGKDPECSVPGHVLNAPQAFEDIDE